MKNLLLSIVLGSTTLLSAAPMSNTDEDVRQKRDNIHQRTQSQEQQRQPQRQMNPRDTQRVETQRDQENARTASTY